jgi:hypothetical protein
LPALAPIIFERLPKISFLYSERFCGFFFFFVGAHAHFLGKRKKKIKEKKRRRVVLTWVGVERKKVGICH